MSRIGQTGRVNSIKKASWEFDLIVEKWTKLTFMSI
jgi:hypothetical protein